MLNGLSLASLSFRKSGDDAAEQAGLKLHDLHLEFCRQQADSMTVWHSSLLNGCMPTPFVDEVHADLRALSPQHLVRLKPRAWWSGAILKDGYMHENLCRHLSCCGLGSELAALLLDARWANMRGKLGGILGLQTDFEILDQLTQPGDSSKGENATSMCLRESFQLILKAMKLSWGRFSYGQRAFQFQMCGRLLSLNNTSVIIDSFVKSFETHTPKPHLLPVSSFFPELNSAQILEIPLGGWCRSVACSPCGRYIAAGSGDDIIVADAITGDVLRRLKGHSDNVTCIRFTEESKKLVSASEDTTVAVWEWEKSDAPDRVLTGHTDGVTDVAVSRDGKLIVSASRDFTLRFWNGTTGSQSDEFKQRSRVECVALSPDDRTVAFSLSNGTLKVLDSCTGEIYFENTYAHTQLVWSVAFSPIGQLLVTGSQDATIRLWDAETWAAIDSPVQGHYGWVRSVALHPEGQQLVSCSYDNTVRLWDVTREARAVGTSNRFALSERSIFSTDSVRSVMFTSDGKRFVTGSVGGIVRVWDAAFGSQETQRSFGHSERIWCVSISPDGLRVASGSEDKTVRLWNAKTGALIWSPLKGHTDTVSYVSFSPDGRHLVSSSWDGTLRMWDTETFTQVGNPFEGHSSWVNCVSYSCDGNRIVSGGYDTSVRLWNVATGEQIGDPLTGHTNDVRYVSESSDGRFVVSQDRGGETIIRDRRSSAIVWRSEEHEIETNYRITSIVAESIIRSCGQETPHLRPSCFPESTAEMYCKGNSLYFNVNGDNIPVGNLPSDCDDWKYEGVSKVFAAALRSGGVAFCRLML